MARKEKVDNALLKRLERTEQKRKIGARAKRKFFLIVCEGEKTEPYYFEGLKKDLPKGVLDFVDIDIDGTGKNTLSIIEQTIKLRKEASKQYDQVWAVFDRDSFPPDNFDNAILRAQANKIRCAWSNEAFELWYLLHFNYHDSAISRRQYKGLIERGLSSRLEKRFKYRKNDPEMYELLKSFGNIQQAITWAKRLESAFPGRKDYSKHNPCTKVYRLVQELCELAIDPSCKG
jgi:hypothetical protein